MTSKIIVACVLLLGTACLHSRFRMNQDGAVDSMRKIKAAEISFRKKACRYGDLKELAAADLINSSLADGTHLGYRFEVGRRMIPILRWACLRHTWRAAACPST